MILTEVGEIGVYFDGRELMLRPSLYAMSKLGNKTEIVDIYSRVMMGDLAFSLAVIQSCCDDDIRDIFGCIDDDLTFIESYASKNEIIIIAQTLMNHGIIGVTEKVREKSDQGSYTKEFDVKKYVSMAVAHLGIGEREAWQMTMTSIVGALQAKFPPQPSKYMSEEKENELLAWFEKQGK